METIALPKVRHLQIIALVETGKRIRGTVRVGGAEICPDETVAIHRVERKFVRVDDERHSQPGRSQRAAEEENGRPRRVENDVDVFDRLVQNMRNALQLPGEIPVRADEFHRRSRAARDQDEQDRDKNNGGETGRFRKDPCNRADFLPLFRTRRDRPASPGQNRKDAGRATSHERGDGGD